ncbi:MAG: T9SS type A sorting domain-containing protein [Candidatus Cloacimonetes bacterium]|nr:T9SS type A sorting domain-containing protein [Candidatus Cloacimonadota bacterium]
MKKILIAICTLFITILLIADFSEPIQINADNVYIENISDQAIKSNDGFAYVVYKQSTSSMFNFQIIFSRIALDEDIHSVELFSIENNQLSDPALEILPNGKINVFYTSGATGSLYKSESIDNGQTFSTTIIMEDVNNDFQIGQINGIIEIYHRRKTYKLSDFQHFTNTECSENSEDGCDLLKFWGPDELYGKVHSNDDIYIMWNENSFPVFHDFVSTAGSFIFFPENPPYEDIFLGGYEEYVDEGEGYNYSDVTSEIRNNAIFSFPSDKEIISVQINGNTYTSMMADIEFVIIDTPSVHSWFPNDADIAETIINDGGNWYEESNHIWTNYVPIYDTIWQVGPSGVINNGSVFVESELWVEGVVAGKQTWGCAENIYLVGDITYQNTCHGLPPDDPDSINFIDYLGLVSEKKIIIKYKHRDPETNEIVDANCCDIMLYGFYAALGQGDEEEYGNLACHYDGSFTFEYQHPHGSTPDFSSISPFTGIDTTYTYIDFHKYIFPPDSDIPPNIQGFTMHSNIPAGSFGMSGYPYESPEYLESYPNTNSENYSFPYGTDYPWYNPVWPESAEDIVCERGSIYLYGTIAQTRRGFIHRSGCDPHNHPNQTEWDLDNFHYGGNHSATGYNKQYYGDRRFLVDSPLHFIEMTRKNGENTISITKLYEDNQTETIFSYDENAPISGFQMSKNNDISVLAYSTYDEELCYLTKNSDDEITSYLDTPLQFLEKIEDVELDEYGDIVILSDLGLDKISNNQFLSLANFVPDEKRDILLDNENNLIFYETNYPNYFEFYYLDNLSLLPIWSYQVELENWQSLKKIALSKSDTDTLNLVFTTNASSQNDFLTSLYLSSGTISNTYTQDNQIIKPKLIDLYNYPNPFNPTTTISFSFTTGNTEDTELVIYNLKGQKVKTFPNLQINKSPKQQIIWNGTDESGNAVSSGIYFYKLANPEFNLIKKMILLK